MKQNVIFFPDFLLTILTASTPRLGIVLLGRILTRTNPSLQATCCHRGDASAQRAAPGRAKFLSTSLRRRRFRRKFCHSSAGQPCNFCAHEPTLVPPLSSNKKFSGRQASHQNILQCFNSALAKPQPNPPGRSRAMDGNVASRRIFPVRPKNPPDPRLRIM